MKLFTILEDIYGRYATVYHRTSVEDLVNRIYDSGFKPGSENLYGKGFYATYDLESQFKESDMGEVYGNVLVKFQVNIDNFLILDYSEFIKSPLGRQLKYTKEDFIFKQLDYFKINYNEDIVDEYIYEEQYSSELALYIYEYNPNLYKKINGMIFIGNTDGRVLVCYHPNNLLIPISYSLNVDDGYYFTPSKKIANLKWIKGDTNLKYLKSIFRSRLNSFNKNKSQIIKFKDNLTYEIIEEKFPWFLDDDVEMYDVVIGIKGDKLVWYDGEWKSGIWEDGIWKDGYFMGTWKGGKWKATPDKFDGIWDDPNNPKPLNIMEYKDGLTYKIIQKKFPWLLEEDVVIDDVVVGYKNNILIWYKGIWSKGTWEDGIWKGGRFRKDGIWKGGIFEGGWFDGKWYGGEWKGLKFEGEWLDPNNPKPE